MFKFLRGLKEKGYDLKAGYAKLLFSTSDEDGPSNAYKDIPILYAAIRSKARAISQVPLRVWTNEEEPIEVTADPKHVVTNLLEDINPYYSKYEFLEAIVTCLDVYGEAFVIKDKENVDGIPVYLWPQRPDLFTPKAKGGKLLAWEFRKDGEILYLYPDEVIQFKYYNPFNYFSGLSPLAALKKTVTLDWLATSYNERFFRNDGSPGAIYETDQSLTDEQYERIKQQLIAAHQGVRNAFRPILLDGGLKLKDVGKTLKDMAFVDLKRVTREEILAVLGVPKSELSITEDINYATAKQMDKSYWTKTLIPLMRLIEDKLNTDLFKPAGFWCEFDVDSLGLYVDELATKAEVALKYVSMGVPFEEVNRRFNLGFNIAESPVAEQRSRRIERIKTPETIESIRAERWRQIVSRTYPILGIANKRIKTYFWLVEQSILKAITKHTKAVVTKEAEEGTAWLDDIVDRAFDDDKLREAVESVVRDALKLGYGGEGIPDEFTLEVMARRMNKIRGINATSRASLKEALFQTIAQAMSEGVPEDQRAEMIMSVVRDQMRMNLVRARTIARTEVHGAFSEGTWQRTIATNAKRIMWISARDDRVRDTHRDLDGMIVPVGERFKNGLRFPMDPDGPAEEVINCRCVHIEIYD